MYYAVDNGPCSMIFKQVVAADVQPLYAFKTAETGWHFATKYKDVIRHEHVKKKDIWNNSQTFDQLSASLFLLRSDAIISNLA